MKGMNNILRILSFKKSLIHWTLTSSLVLGELAQVWEKLAGQGNAAAYRLPHHSPHTHLGQGRKGGKGNTAQHLFLDPAH